MNEYKKMAYHYNFYLGGGQQTKEVGFYEGHLPYNDISISFVIYLSSRAGNMLSLFIALQWQGITEDTL